MVDPKVTSITPESSAAIDRKNFWGGIFFLPYGTNLLTVNAMYWILPMWVVATVMAGTEGMAWYEMAQKFSAGHTLLALVVAIGLGGIIWMVDATFIMFDLSKMRNAVQVVSQPQPGQPSRLTRLFSNPLLRGLVMRGVVILVSLCITIPYLGDVVQRAELLKKIETHNRNEIAKLKVAERVRIVEKYHASIAAAREEQSQLEESYTLELAGKKYLDRKKKKQAGSELAGLGPVAKAIKERIESKKVEIVKLELDRDGELAASLKLIVDNEATPEGWERLKLSFPKSSTFVLFDHSPTDMEDARILYLSNDGMKIMGLPAEKVIASALLCLLFAVMVALKSLEPQSVGIYLDARVQESYLDYLHGAFDNQLDPSKRSTSATRMGAYAFHEWFYGVYEPNKLSKEQEAELTRLRRLRTDKANDLEKHSKQLIEIQGKIDEDMGRCDSLNRAHEKLVAKNEAEQEQAGKMVRMTRGNMKRRLERLKVRESELTQAILDGQEAMKEYRASMKSPSLGTAPVPGEDSQFDNLNDALSESRLELKATRTNISEQEAALENFEILKADSASSRGIQMSENERSELNVIEKRLSRLNTEHKELKKQGDELQRIVKLLDEQVETIELGQFAVPPAEPFLKLASGN